MRYLGTMVEQLLTHHRTCNLCEAMCGLTITHDGKKVHSIKGDKEDTFSQGYICPKAVALQDIYEDPDRLKMPVKKTPDGHVTITWEEAFQTIEDRVKEVIAQHGPDSFGVYQGNPNVHNHGTMLFGPQFVRTLRTKHRYSATSVDQLPHHFAAQFMFGHMSMMPIPDIDRTDFFLILGGNPVISNGSIMTAPGMPRRLKDLRKRGGRLVVIDPRRTETAALADEHHFITPGTDAFLLMSMLHVIVSEDLVRPGSLEGHLKGLDQLRDIVAGYSPAEVAELTGINGETITELARSFASTEHAVIYGRIGVSVQVFGGLCQWLINVLNIVTGHLDSPGGAMFPVPAIDAIASSGPRGTMSRYNRWQSRSGLPEFGSELPASCLAEEIATPGDDQIKVLFTSAGNPVLSTPNGKALDEALTGLEFMFSIDIYINETTRHADIILPPATGLETPHYDISFHQLAVRNTTKYSEALFPKADGAMYDWEIFSVLRDRFLPKGETYDGPKTPAEMLDMGLKYGPYGKSHDLTLQKVKDHPHGIDLGPLQPCLLQRLFTPDNKIDLTPQVILADLPRLKTALQDTSHKDLLLIGRRNLRCNNSWMHNSHRLVKGPKRCTLMMHPQDARGHNIEDGHSVTVTSRIGSISAPVEISDEIMPGVVSLPHGWGHTKKGSRMTTAEAHAGVSCNDITDHKMVDLLTGNAAVNGVPVRVARAEA